MKMLNGIFNSIQLSQITSMTFLATSPGLQLVSFRVLPDSIPKLEQILRLKAPAQLILSDDREIEGKIVHYSADVREGYEITIEAKRKD